MAACAALLLLRPGPRAARAAWLIVLIAGLTHAVALNLLPRNLVNINVVHHYLGAKYAIPYADFYRSINAALERPQVSMRDLQRPPAMLRDDPREQRAYYIDLMRGQSVEFEPLAPLPELRQRAEASGAIATDSRRILRERLDKSDIGPFREDTRRAVAGLGWERDITTDYGFNGSPFYALARHLDPTLWTAFGRRTAWLNLCWQIAAALAVTWIVGLALDVDINDRLAMAALLFASWDFVGWALPGLIFAGLWLPVAVALLAARRGKPAAAGLAIAWAGLIKLFPFVLLLPHVLRPAKSRGVLVWGAASTAVLGTAALLSGRSWIDFLHKIAAQFQSSGYLQNSVSLSNGLLALGLHDSPVLPLLAVTALVTLGVMVWRDDGQSSAESIPRRSLVILAATGCWAQTWFNYYAITPLLLLPLLARRHRVGAAAAAFGMAIAYLLPEFDDPQLWESSALHALKVAPYVLIPAWLVVLELRRFGWTRRARRFALMAVALIAAVTAAEIWRVRTIDRLDRAADLALSRRDAQGGLEHYRALLRLAPRNPTAHMNEAIALVYAGRRAEAGAGFARAAALAPADPIVLENYGRWLLSVERIDESAAQLETARELAPHDDGILLDLARARLMQGRHDEARDLLFRAQELQPANEAVRQLLGRFDPPG